MATSVKSKFAGFLRGLIGRPENREPARPAAPPASAPAPATFSSASRPASAPAPFRAPANGAASADVIELPLASIVAAMPADLRAKWPLARSKSL